MNPEPNGALVIFDLDGTLVDSAPDLVASITFALTLVNIDVPSVAAMTSYIGNGAGRLVHRCLTNSFDGIADEKLFDRASRSFFDHYSTNVCAKSAVYPQVTSTLTELKNCGYRLACVTNKPARFTEPLLAQIGLSEFFSITLSGDSLEKKKPAPDQLLHAAKWFDIAPECCTMVGDTVTDIEAARRANMQVISVSYGYGSRSELLALGPDAIVDSIDQIVDIIAE
ncbi:MAG: phosphoglycolate phosphatase [Proteobacteria bacterium]|nr:phosphoglycolate phosphatase [Pseudomonadota bacterium]